MRQLPSQTRQGHSRTKSKKSVYLRSVQSVSSVSTIMTQAMRDPHRGKEPRHAQVISGNHNQLTIISTRSPEHPTPRGLYVPVCFRRGASRFVYVRPFVQIFLICGGRVVVLAGGTALRQHAVVLDMYLLEIFHVRKPQYFEAMRKVLWSKESLPRVSQDSDEPRARTKTASQRIVCSG
ncbi:uncharacterized protein LY79DRAFT_539349 [Colletotrichum navitas]|uniref:Uncharacterized protein n=1 Tax=Colletotrichum navitas TaxID=681940 RepID=A0AAD8V9D9_9PEZI|nr:uncharacterized protein LY79DRAFT_539349 [Colletotrichum navitas]KAK1597874.1 hypothetical protein LY79DRAFT_539349 [Colletotrichum navitas]